jgi:phage major head subunit gpT-like protein
MRSDRSRYLSDKITELFTACLTEPVTTEYSQWTKEKKSTLDQEIYDSVGCFGAAQEKSEGGDFHYETIPQMYQTTVINKTYDKGFYATMEEVEDDPEKIISKINMSGLKRAMDTKKELNSATVVDGVFTTTAADGVYYASDSHPLDTSKTASVNDNLMAASGITPENIILGCNMFNSIKDYAGNLFLGTQATAFMSHKNHESRFNAIQQSNLKAYELSNTKNTVPKLKGIFGKFLNAYYWHLLDENIDSFIYQKRRGLQELEDQDRIKNGNYYWNMNERYRMAQINPGFGHVSNPWTGS